VQVSGLTAQWPIQPNKHRGAAATDKRRNEERREEKKWDKMKG
jgi:hypothetical protein